MDVDQLKRANELIEIIKVTIKGLLAMEQIEDSIRSYKENRYYDDGLYSLNVGLYKDFSGEAALLNRYIGNAELVKVIKETLEKQLKEFEDEFSSL